MIEKLIKNRNSVFKPKITFVETRKIQLLFHESTLKKLTII